MREPVHWLGCPHRNQKAECSWKYLDGPNSLKIGMSYYIQLSVNNSFGETVNNISIIETKYQGRLLGSAKFSIKTTFY